MESLVWIHSEGNTRAPTLSGVNAWAAPSAGAMQNNKSSQWKDHVTAGERGGGDKWECAFSHTTKYMFSVCLSLLGI